VLYQDRADLGVLGGLSSDFDIKDLLPTGFQLRDPSVASTIQVAPLPPGLQAYLASILDEKGRKDDLVGLLSQDHLQFLHSQFLGARREKIKDHPQHPIWSAITESIRMHSNVEDLPKTAAGLSTTLNEYIRQYSTAVGNLWRGNIYYKSFDYLTRILLRLHLAPVREAAFMERTKEYARRKVNNRQEAASLLPSRRRKLWIWRVKRLTDQLAEAIQKERSGDAITIILQRLAKLKQDEPSRPEEEKGRIPPLKDQLRLSEADKVESEEEMGDFLDGLSMHVQDELFEAGVDDDDICGNDDDDLSETEDAQTADIDVPKLKEPSRAHLRSLQAVFKTLLESPFLHEKVDASWVRKTGHVNNKFTDKECHVVATLVNTLRPYVPKRQSSTQGSLAHVALRAPVVYIANAIFRATGYHKFTRIISPSVSPSSLYGLILNGRSVFDFFCSNRENQFSIVDLTGERLSWGKNVAGMKRQVFGAFFDLHGIDKICQSHGLTFANR
jgi:hypothetical protein